MCKSRAILNDVLIVIKTQQSLSSSIIYGRHARDKTKSKKIINLFVEVIITKHRKTILRLPKIDKTIEVFRILALWLALPYFGSSLCRPGTVLEIQMTSAESEGLWKSMSDPLIHAISLREWPKFMCLPPPGFRMRGKDFFGRLFGGGNLVPIRQLFYSTF